MKWLVSHLSPHWVFERVETPRGNDEVGPWWEARRLFYNIILVVAGFASMVTFFIIDQLPPQLPFAERDIELISICFGPIVGLVAANVFYTAGWITEVLIQHLLRRGTRSFGPVMLKAGLVFSILVVWTPTILNGLDWLHRVVYGTRLGE